MNYIKIPFQFIMDSTNDYVIHPTLIVSEVCVKGTNDYLIQPINETIVQPTFNTFSTLKKKEKYVRFNDIIETHPSINSVNVLNDNELSDEEIECIKCYHLKENKQTYFEHLSESLSYSGRAFKSSFYFFIHAFIPDLFQYNGSATLYSLTDTIKQKYESNLEETISSPNDEV